MKMKSTMKKLVTLLTAISILITSVVAYQPQTVEAASNNSITLEKKYTSLYVGESYTLKATEIYKNGKLTASSEKKLNTSALSYKNFKFKSSNSKVAAVSQKGVVTAKKKGAATITMTNKKNSKIKVSFKLNVKAKKTAKITLAKKSASIGVGGTVKITVKKVSNISSKDVKFSTSDKKVATVSKKGVVTGKSAGTAKITVTSALNKKAKATFNVTVTERNNNVLVTSISTASEVTLQVGSGIKFAYTILPANATNKEVVLSSNNPSVAKVVTDAGGTGVLGISAGKATITIKSVDGNAQKKVKVTVKKKIVPVTEIKMPINTNIDQTTRVPIGEDYSKKIKAEVYPSNATNKTLYWTSSDPSVATVDQDGVVTGVSQGTCRITAHSCDGKVSSYAMKIDVKMYIASEQQAYQYLREHPEVTELEFFITKEDAAASNYFGMTEDLFEGNYLPPYGEISGIYADCGYGRLWYWIDGTPNDEGIDIWQME